MLPVRWLFLAMWLGLALFTALCVWIELSRSRSDGVTLALSLIGAAVPVLLIY